MDWALIFDMILEFIAMCQERRDQAEIRAGLRSPKLREHLAMRRVLRESTNLRGRALGAAAREGIADLKALSDDELDSLMDDANDVHLARIAPSGA
jgi:hypothetical protein